MLVDHLTLKRWRRFGHDRLYVYRHGAQIGWWDLVADVPHAEVIFDVPAVHDAVVAWRAGRLRVDDQTPVLPAVPPPASCPVPAAPLPVPPPVPGHDLTSRAPGEALLARAAAERQAAEALSAAAVPPRPGRPSAWRRFLAWLSGVAAVPPPVAPLVVPAERSWLVGAAGEQRVAAVLQSLTRVDPLWQALHSIPVGTRGADLDHLVMGPGGVFTLNTKHHPRSSVWVGGDAVLVNGAYQPYVRKSRYEAARASSLLSQACGFPVPVRGLVVTVGARLSVKTAPADVVVLDEATLASWLRRQPALLTTATLGHVHAAARHPSTWSPDR